MSTKDGKNVYVDRQMLTDLAENEKRYRDLFEHMLHEVHVWELVRDDDGTIKTWKLVDANPAALKSWGKSLQETIGKTTDEIFPQSGATGLFMPIVQKIFEDGKPHTWETDLPDTGQCLHMISIPHGDYFISTGLDISERKAMENEAHATVLRLRQAIKAGNVGLWDWDLATNKVYYSPEWKQQIGYEDDEISNDFTEWEARVHPDDIERALNAIRDFADGVTKDHEVEFRFLHKDGSYRHILAHASLIKDEHGKPVRMLGSHIDVTNRKKWEKALLQRQKMDAVGSLAGGIAHDFNNLLTIIAGNVSHLLNNSQMSEEDAGILRDVLKSVDQGTGLTRQLLTFAKGGTPIISAIDISSLIPNICKLSLSGSSSICTFSISDDLWHVKADKDQLSQVFSNIVINAAQSMPNGGEIRISVENTVVKDVSPLPLPAGNYVKTVISDQGKGIPQDHLSKIFEPFFSTKADGTGLGLSTSYSIVKRHDGLIVAESLPGGGATFTIYLPGSEERAEFKEKSKEVVVKGQGKILVMDDDTIIREMLARMLDALGYHAVVCGDGQEAIELYKEAYDAGHPFDLVLLDLTVAGGMGGIEAIAELSKIDSRVKAIASSGYSDAPVMSNYKDYGFCNGIPKPFKMAKLSRVLKEVLEAE